MKYIIDIARPSLKVDEILQSLNDTITVTIKGQKQELKWHEGLDHT